MKISPMDLQRQTFAQRLRGFDPAEVRTYLNIVAEEVAALQRERDRLEPEGQSPRPLVDEHRQRETTLKNTPPTAQRLSQASKEAAPKRSRGAVNGRGI